MGTNGNGRLDQAKNPYRVAAEELIRNGKPGDELTFEEIAATIGVPIDCNPPTKGYGHLQRAMAGVLKEYGLFWFHPRRTKKIVCANDAEAARAAGGELVKSRRRVKKSLDIALTVDRSKLEESDRGMHDANVILAAMHYQNTKASARKEIASIKSPKQPKFGLIVNAMKE